jgi:hypothetical protein
VCGIEVLMAARMTLDVWVVKPCGVLVDTNISEEHLASIYRADIFLKVHVAL